MHTSIESIRRANAKAGFYFFEAGALRFFASRIGSTVYGGKYFITSEQFRPSSGPPARRKYSVRMIRPDGSIDTIGGFQAYASRSGAASAALRLASQVNG
jgi:hypothetical protein